MTTVPSIDRVLSALRMASTAAWSAFFSSPRPISLDAASAAASVTRTASSARLRSSFTSLAIVSSVGACAGASLKRLDADQARLLGHRLQLHDPPQRPPHGCFLGLMRGQHHGHLTRLRAP